MACNASLRTCCNPQSKPKCEVALVAQCNFVLGSWTQEIPKANILVRLATSVSSEFDLRDLSENELRERVLKNNFHHRPCTSTHTPTCPTHANMYIQHAHHTHTHENGKNGEVQLKIFDANLLLPCSHTNM